MTPDGGRCWASVPGLSGLVLAAGFSGTGFKISPAVGEAVAALVTGSPVAGSVDIGPFWPGRFAEGRPVLAPVPVLGRLRERACHGKRACHRGGHGGEAGAAREAGMSPDDGVPLERSLPGRSYTSEAEFARERDQVLLPGWFCVGRADGLAEPGCYLAADVCGESIIVTRADGRRPGRLLQPVPAPGLAAGARGRVPSRPLTRAAAGGSTAASAARTTPGPTRWTGRCAPRRSCPRCASTGPRCRCTAVDVATWGGFVFARLEPPDRSPAAATAPPRCAGDPARMAAYPLADLRSGARLRYDVAANWKVILENYNECYHCGPVHPELCELVPAFRARRRRPGLGGGDPAPPRGDHVHGDRDHPPGPVPRADRGPAQTRHFGELVLPNLMLSLSADHVAAFTVWPRCAGRTTVLCDFLFHPDELARPDFDAVRRGRLLGPGEPPGLAHLRAGPGRHAIPPVLGRLPGADGAAQRRHGPLRPRAPTDGALS